MNISKSKSEQIDEELNFLSHYSIRCRLKARKYRRFYHMSEFLTLLSGALVFFVNTMQLGDNVNVKVISAVIGSVVVLATGVSRLYKYQENWNKYEEMADQVSSEVQFFKAQVDEYDGLPTERAYKIFVLNIENIKKYGKKPMEKSVAIKVSDSDDA